MSSVSKYRKYDDAIILSALELDVGESTKEHPCPKCGGGDTKEKAFNMTRVDAGILYKCHRGKCGLSGFVPTMLSSLQTTPKEHPHRRLTRPYTGEMLELDVSWIYWFWHTYGLTKEETAEFRLGDKGRIVQPWHAANGHIAGHILRSYDGQKPKSLTYWNNDGVPILDYYFPLKHISAFDKPVWLVEDQLSAKKLARYVPSAALIGCHISEEQAADIRKSYKHVFLARTMTQL